MITKADIVLAIVLLILGLGSPFLLRSDADGESRVILTMDGEEIGDYALSEDRTVSVTGEGGELLNLVVIENGTVRVEEANCKGQDCVRMGAISKEGEVIACLPHKLLITVTGGKEQPDAVIK